MFFAKMIDKIRSLIVFSVFTCIISFPSSLLAANKVYIEGNNVKVVTQKYKHSFTIQEKLENASFWVLSVIHILPPPQPDSIIYFYACAAEMIPSEMAPENEKVIEVFEKAKERHVLIKEGTPEWEGVQRVMDNCTNYFLIPDGSAMRRQLEKIKFKDTLALSGYILKYNGTEKNNKPVRLSANVAKGPFILVKKMQFGVAANNEMSIKEDLTDQFCLTGIMRSKEKGSFVLINGKIVREGESVGNARLKKIGKDFVILDIDGKMQKLTLK